ncbi:Phosphodiest-domain-containing protein [Hysterangium stoloniferum]|nr:Phosphodiest-domain-containing protein [Hysterangium stoloniferum]
MSPQEYDLPEREEREGLLSGATSSKEVLVEDEHLVKGWSRKALVITAISFIGVLLIASLLPSYLGLISSATLYSAAQNDHIDLQSGAFKSNGTHDFKSTVLVVSIDGLRADYLDRGLTPHLLEISRTGLRAKWMQPVFPTLTFPNHWALLTGLFAESHGIVANNFWDPETQSVFSYSNPTLSWNASWWKGEPIWETASKAGLITANLMWPGPPVTMTGISPTYYVPFKDKVPLRQKLDQILNWIDLPSEKRPQLLLAYEPSLDQAGHKAGPASKLVNDTLAYVDAFARDLHAALRSRNLTDIIDIIFVSDHGMTDTQQSEFIYLENLIGKEYVDAIEHEDGWPSMGLRFGPDVNASHVLELLTTHAEKAPEKFSVYTQDNMPPSYHFSNNPRIAPIYIVPKVGYAVTNDKEGAARTTKGVHGYDNAHPSMYAMFVSDGPFSAKIKQQKRRPLRSLSNILSRRRNNDGWHTASGETYIIRGFRNVELYGLVTKLLDIESFAAKTNGTAGFWDKYL